MTAHGWHFAQIPELTLPQDQAAVILVLALPAALTAGTLAIVTIVSASVGTPRGGTLIARFALVPPPGS